ncbi:Cephalosporin-C deacetylase [Filimonas lacunae]|uniref:Cephalosporin-C deacetylase n=1 Tax=Filimonas lacunae TaxID=477680 RepID=A0A173MDH4_9BACT|nr:acetylxylan esterase [Filimonas lacunae]BAV05615.1 acetyl xylan esterase [Filimonas lacunae]SIT29188.1 Cephalosporin-C deacetylase [Filimonas lacunae]
MKYLLAAGLFFTCQASLSQNLLPLVWQISTSDTIVHSVDSDKLKDAGKVNLMLSWERQGYFYRTGTCRLAADFYMPASYADTALALNLRLPCHVKGLYVNGSFIGGDIANQFWTKRDEVRHFTLDKQLLLPGSWNRISIVADEFSYTGGKTNSLCSLTPVRAGNDKEKVSLSFSGGAFVFHKDAPFINIASIGAKGSDAEVFIVNDLHDTLYHTNVAVTDNKQELSLYVSHVITEPGFYECVVVQKGKGFTGDVKWFALDPEKIKGNTQEPGKFTAYWKETMQELSGVKPDFRVKKCDSLSKGKRNAYIIEFTSLDSITIRGYYFVPRTKQKYAALLHLPGYGYGFNKLESFVKSKENVAELALCVRGHGISADVFNPGFDIPGVWGWNLHNEKQLAYRAIYMDCIRAIEFLRSRPEVDAKRIGVLGSSQGGGLTLATAGLMQEKVKACAYFDPFPCSIRDLVKVRKLCVDEWSSYLKYYNNPISFDEAMDIQDLVDTRLMASRITCKAFYATGLFDDDCPSRVGFAAYNAIKTPKKYRVYPADGHLGESSPYADMMQFLKRELHY